MGKKATNVTKKGIGNEDGENVSRAHVSCNKGEGDTEDERGYSHGGKLKSKDVL